MSQSAYRRAVSSMDAIFAIQDGGVARHFMARSPVHMCLYDLQNALGLVEYPLYCDKFM